MSNFSPINFNEPIETPILDQEEPQTNINHIDEIFYKTDEKKCSRCGRCIKPSKWKTNPEFFYSVKHDKSSPIICRSCHFQRNKYPEIKEQTLKNTVEKELQNRINTATIQELLIIRDKSQQTEEKNRTNDMIDKYQRMADALVNHNCENPECHIRQVLTKFFNKDEESEHL